MKLIFASLSILLTVFSCRNRTREEVRSNSSENPITETKSLLENVKLAINPKFQDWVLFENGTYIIFDDISEIENVRNEAIKMMKEFGPVLGGGPAGDFGVTSLTETHGWVVSCHAYGMYTYVHPLELDVVAPDDVAIGLFGRSKRNKDGQELNIIYVNSSND